MILDCERLVRFICDKMIAQADEAGVNKVAVGISGGVDSALIAALSVKAFGCKNVIGVYSDIESRPKYLERAHKCANTFGFKLVDLDLNTVYRLVIKEVELKFRSLGLEFPDENELRNKTIFGGLKSCLRAPILRFVNRAFGGGIVQGTGNRDEDHLLRFYQKGGDGEVDANWMGCLYKSEVWELAQYMGVPKEIIEAKPDHDLWGQIEESSTDESELYNWSGVNLTYGKDGTIEWVGRVEQKFKVFNYDGDEFEEMLDLLKLSEERKQILRAVKRIEKITRHKALPPPTIDRSQVEDMRLVK